MSVMLASIDCDPGIDFPQRTGGKARPSIASRKNYSHAVVRLFRMFDEVGLKGAVTWFINETDVEWTRDYPELLREIVLRHDTIAVHVHHNGLFNPRRLEDKEAVLETTGKAIGNLEQCVECRVRCHRSGCYFQSEFVYRAISELGLAVLSDVFPGYKGKTRGGQMLDNSPVPLNAKPWRHDEANWMDFQSVEGQFVHIPVCAGDIGHMAGLAEKTVVAGMEVMCWGIHPHEIQNPDGTVNEECVASLSKAILQTISRLNPICRSFDSFLAETGDRK